MAQFWTAVSTAATYRLEFRLNSDRLCWVTAEGSIERDADGRPVRVRGIIQDVTVRKKAELTLAERESQLGLAGKAARVGSFAVDYATQRIQASPGYAAIHGLAEGTEEYPRAEWRARVHPDDLPRVDVLRRQAFAERGTEHHMEYRIVGEDGETRWIESRGLVSYDGEGRPTRLVGVHIDITARKRAEDSLSERNVQLALAGKAGLVGSWAYDTDTEIMRISEGYAAIHGFPEGSVAIPRNECLATVHSDDIGRVRQVRSDAFSERRREYSVEYRIFRPGGEMRWVETRCFITYDGEGRARRVVGVSIDITERKRVEEQQSRLVAELDHRVKNVLATVQAVAAHTMQASSSMEHFVAALDGRIRSMSSTHELLSHRRWAGIPLAELVQRELAPYATGSNTEIGGPVVMLSAEAGQTMATVLHELVTNAAKYGALSVPSGRVSISWRVPLNGGASDKLVLTWREISGPLVVPPSKTGYGMDVVSSIIPYELGGTVDHVLAPEGARCQMEIPLAHLSGGSSQNNGSASAYSFNAPDDIGGRRQIEA
jgi:PAS domain S-box-containing protein